MNTTELGSGVEAAQRSKEGDDSNPTSFERAQPQQLERFLRTLIQEFQVSSVKFGMHVRI